MDNYAIADQFSLLAKLMDIHGENSFKAKSYSSAAFNIEKITEQLSALPEEKLFSLKGIGDSVGKKVMEIIQTGELKTLQELIAKTPEGVLEMMNIKGLGPKKINTLWKEMNIDTIEELEKACRENRIAAVKGFGGKTEQKILASIEFVRTNEGKFLYKHVEDFALALTQKIEQKFPAEKTSLTGEFRRQMEIISQLEWVTTVSKEALKNFLSGEGILLLQELSDLLVFRAEDLVNLEFHLTTKEAFANTLLETSSSDEFRSAWKSLSNKAEGTTEEELFQSAGLSFVPPFLRESKNILQKAATQNVEDLVQTNSIKGLIHSHSNWSDGSNTLEQMAEELIRLGFEYLVISDHSKAAGYANGLSEQRIKEQHKLVDSLNKKFAPFKIFKSIECDILGDGTLDYDDKVLSTFDLVITSVHSNLDMEEDKAMMRLMGAITNPYTTILGHMTGRLLLRRKGYPVDHKSIIDACAKHNVVIEINASPSRLDMDWRWIDYAVEKGVLLSIDPDAHSLEEFRYVKYGTLVAQKGGLPASKNLSSFSLAEFERFLEEQRKKRPGNN
ncbi:helix-hairpin-helix domain-containing protein [Flavisolibacter ginsenosidimutans]|uniref:DNA polymerase/3'-5' exonuclease PolX n=1 Tax=Flavisolibacter ginsenosidimutans TaxID=661481 RepID=A0A5B8UNU9_9BACT|nr:helix-hairpin-helix domain-containing protein [Flavisolibacter ginsenosidimutans]QEC58278.1 DNA polymerase/3'-5' exonuclease PolX [Flavisolibacter ginsenosidimutans]